MRKPTAYHPLLFAIFPILFLYAHNADEISITEVFTPIAIALILALAVWAPLTLLVRDRGRAAFITTLFLFLFFSFGHLHDSVRSLQVAGVKIGHGAYLIALFALLLTAVSIRVKRARGSFHKITRFLNAFALFMVASSLVISARESLSWQEEAEVAPDTDTLAGPENAPDIYYLILDAYGRADILAEMYDYDNGEFLRWLESRGFYVAEQSAANYPATVLSLASALNMTYLDDLAARVEPGSKNLRPVTNLIRHSAVAEFLKKRGYRFVTFSSGHATTEIRNSDVYLTKPGLTSEFQNILLGTTPLPRLLRKTADLYELHRDRLLFMFEQLEEVPRMESPMFVFAHIKCPHAPFVFDENGEPVGSDRPIHFRRNRDMMPPHERVEYIDKYQRQLSGLNLYLMAVVDSILAGSSRPPVILLQGDHGPSAWMDYNNVEATDMRERMPILNAYYLPVEARAELYPTITPVNSFRLIFDALFGTRYGRLEDELYFSSWRRPYEFHRVTDRVRLAGGGAGAAQSPAR